MGGWWVGLSPVPTLCPDVPTGETEHRQGQSSIVHVQVFLNCMWSGTPGVDCPFRGRGLRLGFLCFSAGLCTLIFLCRLLCRSLRFRPLWNPGRCGNPPEGDGCWHPMHISHAHCVSSPADEKPTCVTIRVVATVGLTECHEEALKSDQQVAIALQLHKVVTFPPLSLTPIVALPPPLLSDVLFPSIYLSG